MQLKKLLFHFFIFVFSFSLLAEEKVLCDLSSDMDSDTGKIVYEMDSENRGIEHLYQDSYRKGTRVGRIELKAEALREGIILNQKDNHIIVRIHSDNYDADRGGVLYIDTLYSGISGERREYVMEMAMDKEGPVLHRYNKPFNKMAFVAKRSKVFGIIGIERINFN